MAQEQTAIRERQKTTATGLFQSHPKQPQEAVIILK